MSEARGNRPPLRWLQMVAVILIMLVLVLNQVWIKKVNKELLAVETVVVEKQDLEASILATGSIRVEKQHDYIAKQTTKVKEVKKEAGAHVATGDLLLLLDNSQALMNLGKAESLLAIQELEYRQAITNKSQLVKKLTEARKNLERLRKLYEMGSVSQEEFDLAEKEVTDAEAQAVAIDLKALETHMNKQRQAIKSARGALTETVITSPFEGSVLQVGVKAGQTVTAGMLLVSVGKLSSMEVECSIGAMAALNIKDGQTVEIDGGQAGEGIIVGHVAGRAPLKELDPDDPEAEAKVILKIGIDEKKEALKPGLDVNVKIPLEKRIDALVVPKEAIVERNGKNVVFVYQDGVAQIREVQIGYRNDTYQEITAGVSSGELVITAPLDVLQDQTKVKLYDKSK